MAEKQNVMQICCSRSSKMISRLIYWCGEQSDRLVLTTVVYTALPKAGSRFRLRLSESKSLLVEGEWIANRSK